MTTTPGTAQDTTAWPQNVTARFLNRTGLCTGNDRATVDITETNGRAAATCRPCGWTSRTHGLAYRDEVLDWAQDHADRCTALPQPTA